MVFVNKLRPTQPIEHMICLCYISNMPCRPLCLSVDLHKARIPLAISWGMIYCHLLGKI